MNSVAKPHVFVSYVREDRRAVEKLCEELKRNEVAVWLDREKIRPGERWQIAIRRAIEEGALFIACFSTAYADRHSSYMNVELTIAVEQLRSRPSDRAWFIPVLLEGGVVPDRPIGGGETLRDIQWVDLTDGWDEGVGRILSVLLPEPPQPRRQPSAPAPATLVILMTDLINSTAALQRLSDREFRDVILRMNEELPAAVKGHGGQVVTVLGDGLLAVFESAPKAVVCALALQSHMSKVSNLGTLEMRIGLAAGPVLRTHDSVGGTAVNMAARICSLAEGGEVLISDSVRALLDLTEGVQVMERGPVALKGIMDRVRVYAVRPAAAL